LDWAGEPVLAKAVGVIEGDWAGLGNEAI